MISTKLISQVPPPKWLSVMSGNITPTGMIRNQMAMASTKNHPRPGCECMAANPSRSSCHRSALRFGRSGFGMRTKSSVVQAISAPTTSSSRMLPIEVSPSSRAPSAGPARSENDEIT